MESDLLNRLRQCPNLPSLPAVAVQVLELAQRPDVEIAEIARIISKDPALSSKILRTVNSSFYGRSQTVSTVSQALVILGLQSVKMLVLGFSLVNYLSGGKSNGFDHLTYWKRSIYSATAAKSVAARLGLVQQEEAFLAALLKDIGMLVLDQVLGGQYGEICSRAVGHHELVELEQAALGTDHAQVGGMLAEQWRLAPLLSVPIALHHRPAEAAEPQLKKIVDVTALSGRCADIFVDDHPAQAIAEVRRHLLEQYEVPEPESDALLEEISACTKDFASLFEINIGSLETYEAILKRANEALVEVTLQSQQQATQLQLQNQELQAQASTDKLTGLANRGRFDTYLREQFSSVAAENKPLALLMIDLDQFKSINDRYGHPAGDQILQAVGKLLRTACRAHDLAARYGGEELALVLPGTTRQTASAIAETIRRAIACRPIPCGSTMLPITASFGVAVFEPGSPLKDPTQLIKAADLALYNAKHSGRNCVRVFVLPKAADKPAAA